MCRQNRVIAVLSAAAFCFAATAATLNSAQAGPAEDNDARIAALQAKIAKLRHENEALKLKQQEIVKQNQTLKDDPNRAYAAYMPTKGPVLTQSPISGYIGLYGGGDWWDWHSGDGVKGNDWIFGGNARVNIWTAPSYSMQFDVDGEATSTSSTLQSYLGNTGTGRANMDIAVHGAWRDPNVGAVGMFGVLAKSTNITYYGGDMIEGLIGAEGQYYMGNVTWYGQAGYMGTLDHSNQYTYAMAPQNTWFARGVGRYFVTSNDKLQGEVGFAQSASVCRYNNCSGSGSASPSYLTWGALYEHRFTGTMWSAYVEYAGFKVDDSSASSGSSPVISNNIMGGIKLNFGEPTLLAQDRHGATFDTPTFLRALNWTYLGGGLY